MTNPPGDILDELVDKTEAIERFARFLHHRLPEACFHLISEGRCVSSVGVTPGGSVAELHGVTAAARGGQGLVRVALTAPFTGHAVHIPRLNAVLLLFSADPPCPGPSGDGDPDGVLVLIELFLAQRDLDEKEEALGVQKKQFKREQHILRQRYYKIQEEAHRLQVDYTRNLNDEIKRQTREIRRSNERLQREIDERKRMVVMANKLARKAHAASRSKSEFLSKMSHELRTPLNSIIGFSDMMTETPLDAEQAEYIDFIGTSSRSLLDLVSDILDLSKIEAGSQSLEHAEFDLAEILSQVNNITKFQRVEKGISLRTVFDSGLDWHLIGDGLRLRQVLVNLIGNAIKFMGRGEITLSVDLEEAGDTDLTVRFSVADEGIGIPANKVDMIFQPFVQVDGSSTRQNGGTGLGLAISDELVKLMGGERISLTSEPGRGSVFFFSLKFPKGTGKGKGTLESGKAGDTDGATLCRVLLVEDVYQNRKLVTAALTRKGFTFDMAENGRQAVEALRGTGVDVVLMDVQMPVMDGLEATRIIRLTDPVVPIIGMTAGAMADDKEKCLAAGMDDYISKPIDIKGLDRKIRAVIRQKKRDLAADADRSEARPGCGSERAPQARHDAPVPEGGVAVPPATLDVAEALHRLENNEELYREILLDFLVAGDDVIAEIREAVDTEALGVAVRLAHSLKGSAATISANRLRQAALALETALRQTAPGRVAPLVDALELALTQALESVRAVVVESGENIPGQTGGDEAAPFPPPDVPDDGNPLPSMVGELRSRLKKCDPVGAMELIASIKKRVHDSGLYDQWVGLEELVNEFEFDEVLKKIDSLK